MEQGKAIGLGLGGLHPTQLFIQLRVAMLQLLTDVSGTTTWFTSGIARKLYAPIRGP